MSTEKEKALRSKRGRRSMRRGKRGEREACEALAGVFPGLQRTYHQSRDGGDAPDIDSDACPVWIEVKRAEAINVHAAVKQVQAAAKGRRPVMVAHKRNRGEWLVTMPVATLARLVHPAIVANVDHKHGIVMIEHAVAGWEPRAVAGAKGRRNE